MISRDKIQQRDARGVVGGGCFGITGNNMSKEIARSRRYRNINENKRQRMKITKSENEYNNMKKKD